MATVALFAAAWAGATILLAETRWWGRRPLSDRLRGHLPGSASRPRSDGVLSVASFRQVLLPIATSMGDVAGRVVDRGDDLTTRLERVHRPVDVAAFRLRQLGWSVTALLAAAVGVVVVGPPPALGVALVATAPLAAAVAVDHASARAARAWQERTALELPVVAEQVGMLLGAGFSLGSALARVGERGSGVVARDLSRALRRTQQGLDLPTALREWAQIARVPAVDRLVAVLALDGDSGDVGHLVADEARNLRHDLRRRQLELIDRREQHVWIPVTVATLLPGVVFLAVPFLEAMSLYTH